MEKIKLTIKKEELISLTIFIITLLFLNADIYNHISYVKFIIGKYIYPLDDSYIHLAISKNLAQHGVWGITKYEFSSTSSSPLFTLIISFLIFIFGNNELIPLYFNLVILNIFLLIIFLNFKNKPLKLLIILWGFAFCVLLKIQVISGMEHMLHVFLISISWIYFHKWYDSNFSKKSYKKIFLLTLPFLCLIRYESIFFISLIILLLLYKKHYRTSILTFILAFTPIIIFGVYSINEGGYFFPNSVLIKGKYDFTILALLKNLYSAIHIIVTNLIYIWILILLISITFIYTDIDKKNIILNLKFIFDENLRVILIILLLVSHLMFASIGWLYRYEAYLYSLLFISIAFNLKILKNSINFSAVIIILVSGSLLLYLSFSRYKSANEVIHFANKNIYDQQVQMSYFIRKYFNNSSIIANDIGAISYYSNIRLHDIVGLGSTDVLEYNLKKNDKDFENYVNSLNYDLMLIYDSWFTDFNFKNKEKVATLYLKNNHICGDNHVSFYIPSKSKKAIYTYNSLIEFQKELPKDIKLKIFFPDSKFK